MKYINTYISFSHIIISGSVTTKSPWYNHHGWLGVKNELSIYLSIVYNQEGMGCQQSINGVSGRGKLVTSATAPLVDGSTGPHLALNFHFWVGDLSHPLVTASAGGRNRVRGWCVLTHQLRTLGEEIGATKTFPKPRERTWWMQTKPTTYRIGRGPGHQRPRYPLASPRVDAIPLQLEPRTCSDYQQKMPPSEPGTSVLFMPVEKLRNLSTSWNVISGTS